MDFIYAFIIIAFLSLISILLFTILNSEMKHVQQKLNQIFDILVTLTRENKK